MSGLRQKKKRLKDKRAAKLTNGFTMLELVRRRTLKYMEDLETEESPLPFPCTGEIVRFGRFEEGEERNEK